MSDFKYHFDGVTYYVGDRVKARIQGNIVIRGVIMGFGTHEGRAVADLDNNHWCFLSQIVDED